MPSQRSLAVVDPLQAYINETRRYPLLSREEEQEPESTEIFERIVDISYKEAECCHVHQHLDGSCYRVLRLSMLSRMMFYHDFLYAGSLDTSQSRDEAVKFTVEGYPLDDLLFVCSQ